MCMSNITSLEVFSPQIPCMQSTAWTICLRIALHPCDVIRCIHLKALEAALQLRDVGSLALQHVSQATYVRIDCTSWLVNLRSPATPFSHQHQSNLLQLRHPEDVEQTDMSRLFHATRQLG